MGLFGRLGRRSSTGATPGETPMVNPAVVARDSGRGTLAGGVLAADRGVLMYGVGGQRTVRPFSRYPGAGDDQGPSRSPGALALARPGSGGVVVGPMRDGDASPMNPPYPPVDPAGFAALRGRLAGGAFASESGAVSRGPGELVNLRYLPMDPKVTDPNAFLPPVREAQGYRPGRAIISYYVDPQRSWGISPMFNGAHGAIRATPYISPPPNSMMPQGSANPTVYRSPPMPWDTGVIRGAVPR